MTEEPEAYVPSDYLEPLDKRMQFARFAPPVDVTTRAMLAFSRAAEVLAAAALETYSVFMDTMRATLTDLCWASSDSGLCLLDKGHDGPHEFDPTPADTLFSFLGTEESDEEGAVDDGTDRS